MLSHSGGVVKIRSQLAQVSLAALLAFSFAPAAAAAGGSGVAWQRVSSDAEVDAAFALSRKTGRPVFLYWGAVWCPPCNQVKATLFSRADFIERSRAFVPVYVDGDRPGAQKIAARFRVTGYPSMVLFKPDGTEITRLPGEIDPQRYLLTLTAGLDGQVSVKQLMERAQGKKSLTPEQWHLLAFYSWDTDEQQVVSSAELPQRLSDLAANVPPELPRIRERLLLKALVARARSGAAPLTSRIPTLPDLPIVEQILADADASRQIADILINYSETIVRELAPAGPSRQGLSGKFDDALARIAADPSLSRSEQVDLLVTRIALWKLMEGSDSLSERRRAEVVRQAAATLAITKDRYERQAVVPGAAYALASAGLLRESDELQKLELAKAVAPYYHMLGLAGNAKKRGDVTGALNWYEQAWKKSQGEATRIQWGTGFVGHVIELAPLDAERVEQAASTVIAELKPTGETFYERNQRSLTRMAERLVKWQLSDPVRGQAVNRLKVQLGKTCARLKGGDAGRANCDAVFKHAGS